ncbi:predicted protein [Postia placenta Mad-698-R]|nr:predicted protein [Postia placenta Mad-698-R]
MGLPAYGQGPEALEAPGALLQRGLLFSARCSGSLRSQLVLIARAARHVHLRQQLHRRPDPNRGRSLSQHTVLSSKRGRTHTHTRRRVSGCIARTVYACAVMSIPDASICGAGTTHAGLARASRAGTSFCQAVLSTQHVAPGSRAGAACSLLAPAVWGRDEQRGGARARWASTDGRTDGVHPIHNCRREIEISEIGTLGVCPRDLTHAASSGSDNLASVHPCLPSKPFSPRPSHPSTIDGEISEIGRDCQWCCPRSRARAVDPVTVPLDSGSRDPAARTPAQSIRGGSVLGCVTVSAGLRDRTPLWDRV